MLKLESLSKTFLAGTPNEHTALDNLSLSLEDGEFVTIVGSNGAGKSTLFNAICGTFMVDSGAIVLDKKDITYLPEHKRARVIGRVFQDQLENAWEVLSGDDEAQAMPMQARASATLTSRNTLQCSDGTLVGFSEGMLANATMNFQSEVTNRGTSSNSATFYVASYLSSGALNDLSTVSTGSISSGSSKIVTKTVSKSLYSTINNIKTYTWDPSMVPCCDAVQYKKNSHNDNFTVGSSILSKANNYLMMKLNTKLNGSLSSSSDVDVVAYKATSTKSVSISKTTPGGSFKVDVYNSSGSRIGSNPTSFSTTAGNTYYLRIYGTTAGNYTVTLR